MAGHETERLDRRCAAIAGTGLVDFRVTLRHGTCPTVEEASADVNAMLDACADGKAAAFSFGDANRTTTF